jgi:hypothetical protein
MKYSMLLKSLLFIILLLFIGCGNNKTKISGIDDLPGFWIFDTSGTLFTGTILETKFEAPIPIIILKKGDSITFATRNNCELVQSNGFILTCKDNYLISTDCNLENSITMAGSFSEYSISGTWTIEGISSGYGCDVTTTINEKDVWNFTGEKVNPHSGDYFKINGKINETEFDFDSNQVLCLGTKDESNSGETDYEFIIIGQNGIDSFMFIFDVASTNGKTTAELSSFQTNKMLPGYIYNSGFNNINVSKYGNVTEAEYTLNYWSIYDPIGNEIYTNTSDTLTGSLKVNCHMYSQKTGNSVIIN